MSTYNEKFTIEKDIDIVSQDCRYALNQMWVAIENESAYAFTIQEKISLFSFGNPAKLQISLSEMKKGKTEIEVKSTNFGFGPVQDKHVESAASKFINAVKLKANEANNAYAALTEADALKKFAELRDQGVISQEEFEAKKKQILGL